MTDCIYKHLGFGAFLVPSFMIIQLNKSTVCVLGGVAVRRPAHAGWLAGSRRWSARKSPFEAARIGAVYEEKGRVEVVDAGILNTLFYIQ
jgi:hypothetical protein